MRSWTITLLLLASLLRFAGLTWAYPYHPHPDERNMATAITQIDQGGNLDPRFYTYGQFPLYLAFFTAKAYNQIPWVAKNRVDLAEAIFFLRFYSALAGVGTILWVLLISRQLSSRPYPLLAVGLATFTPGLIQNSHFGTTESLLTFFFLGLVYQALKITSSTTFTGKHHLVAGLLLGLALGTKITGLVFGLPIFVASLASLLRQKNFLIWLSRNIVWLILVALVTSLSSPYLLLNYRNSLSTLLYETRVAAGQALVFYTRQFINTPPVTFQLQRIFPYALGWPLFLFGSLGFLLLATAAWRKSIPQTILAASFLGYFLSQALLFAKWTRFMAPIFPFFSLFAAFAWEKIRAAVPSRWLYRLLLSGFGLLAIFPGLLFFTIYRQPDIRLAASDWIYRHLPTESNILFDTGNVVDVPVITTSTSRSPGSLPTYDTVSFDFYHLDENPTLFPQLINQIEAADYIIVPSRRIFANHLRLPDRYPKTARYYQLLFSGRLGFKQIKTFYPLPGIQSSVFSFQFSDEQAEETWSVFDHPVIRIFQKEVNLTSQQYEALFD